MRAPPPGVRWASASPPMARASSRTMARPEAGARTGAGRRPGAGVQALEDPRPLARRDARAVVVHGEHGPVALALATATRIRRAGVPAGVLEQVGGDLGQPVGVAGHDDRVGAARRRSSATPASSSSGRRPSAVPVATSRRSTGPRRSVKARRPQPGQVEQVADQPVEPAAPRPGSCGRRPPGRARCRRPAPRPSPLIEVSGVRRSCDTDSRKSRSAAAGPLQRRRHGVDRRGPAGPARRRRAARLGDPGGEVAPGDAVGWRPRRGQRPGQRAGQPAARPARPAAPWPPRRPRTSARPPPTSASTAVVDGGERPARRRRRRRRAGSGAAA